MPPEQPEAQADIWVGNTFIHPVVDYLLVGGAISIPFVIWVLLDPSITPSAKIQTGAFVFLNYAHFASSTVRLYTKRGVARAIPFISYGTPVLFLALVTVAVIWPDSFGFHWDAAYRTWSPYHYAAQAYGLALMYSFKSGRPIVETERTMLWWVCMLPFFWAFLAGEGSGLQWFVSAETLASIPALALFHRGAVVTMALAACTAPVWFFWRLRGRMPLISMVLVAINGVWWLGLGYDQAFFWATIFHSAQYLAIVIVYHVNDEVRRDENQRSWIAHAGQFYAISILLGVTLFLVIPFLYTMIGGFDLFTTMVMVTAGINMHHFLIDGYIWRSKRLKS